MQFRLHSRGGLSRAARVNRHDSINNAFPNPPLLPVLIAGHIEANSLPSRLGTEQRRHWVPRADAAESRRH